MPKPPKSYLNRRRPPLQEAMILENNVAPEELTILQAMDILEKKNYFTASPRPWSLGGNNRGHGHYSYGILDRFGDVVVASSGAASEKENMELIVKAVNELHRRQLGRLKKKKKK